MSLTLIPDGIWRWGLWKTVRFGCDHEDDTNPHDALVSFIRRGQRLELPPHVHVKTGRSLQARKGPSQEMNLSAF